MKITLPTVRIQGGNCLPSTWAIERLNFLAPGIMVSFGKPYVIFQFSSRTFEHDFKIARRLHAASALATFPLLIALAYLIAGPLWVVMKMGEAAERIGELAFEVVLDRLEAILVPVSKRGIRATMQALVKEVTQ